MAGNPAEVIDKPPVILADRLGYHDAFIGEHLTDRLDTITQYAVPG